MQRLQLQFSDLAAISLVVVIWGFNFVVMKVGLAHLTPFQMGLGRYLFAFLPLALMVPPPSVRIRWVVAFGLAQGLGQFGLLFIALKVGMSSALASVLLQTQVFFSAFFGFAVLKEGISNSLKVGMAFAAVGLVCFGATAYQATPESAVTLFGLVLTLMAALMWALSNIFVRLAQCESADFDPLAFIVWCSAIPVLPFAALTWLFDGPPSHAHWLATPWIAWGALAFLGWVATDVGYGLWAQLLKRFPASMVAPFSLGVPLIGLFAGILILGETVMTLQWWGACLVLCALICVLVAPNLARLRQQAP